MNRMLLGRMLSDAGYPIQEAADAEEALQVIEATPPCLILLDVVMPDMTGFELCSRLKAEEATRRIPIVFLTSLDSAEDKIKGLELGAVDFITKPFNPAEIIARVATQARLYRMYRTIMDTNRRMAEELETARRVQRSFLPRPGASVVPGVSFEYAYKPCDELGGDMFNILGIDDEHVLVYMADVSGHGVASALLTIFTDTFFATNARADSQPGDLLTRFNRQFFREQLAEQHIVVFVAMLDLCNNRLLWSSAGQSVAPIYYGASFIDQLELASFPIGLLENVAFEERSMEMHPGTSLLMYSDGVTDVETADGVPVLDEEALVELVRSAYKQSPRELLNLVQGRIATAVPDRIYPDDLTLFMVTRS